MEDIRRNYLETLEKIARCAARSARSVDSIQFLVVTKGQSAEKIKEVIEAGATDLGENYPEETHTKIPLIGSPVHWHMIGHLQSRKIKYIVEDFSMIHSIDRADVAIKLSADLAEAQKAMPALFEVNLSGEESKSGFAAWDENEWPQLIEQLVNLQKLPGLNFCGLMTMPPFSVEPETSRPVFQKCRRLLEMYQKTTKTTNFDQMSMGTSIDYEVAIQEGATYVRVGQAVMGERTYR
jgi:pyridoxal phosphate enzyme (YggS family)